MLQSINLLREARQTTLELEALRTALTEHEHMHHSSDPTARVLRQMIFNRERKLIVLHI
jgi:hypothetical protein